MTNALPAPVFHVLAIAGGIGIGIIAGMAMARLRNFLATAATERQPELRSA